MKTKREMIDFICKYYSRAMRKKLEPKIRESLELIIGHLEEDEEILGLWYGKYRGGMQHRLQPGENVRMLYAITSDRLYWGKNNSTGIIKEYENAQIKWIDLEIISFLGCNINTYDDTYFTELDLDKYGVVSMVNSLVNALSEANKIQMELEMKIEFDLRAREKAAKMMMRETLKLKKEQEKMLKEREKQRKFYEEQAKRSTKDEDSKTDL